VSERDRDLLGCSPDQQRAASAPEEGPSRRQFLEVMGASAALAAAAGCGRKRDQELRPYVYQPEHVVPGRPNHYATAHVMNGFAAGVVVESHEGRPIKLEGNEQHPASLGKTDAFTQASILDLYDPDRSAAIRHRGRPASWPEVLEALRAAMVAARASGGRGLRILTGAITSPTLVDQLARLSRRFPNLTWHRHDPVGQDQLYAGLERAFGRPLAPLYRFREARVVVALDADLLGWGPGAVRYAHDWARLRKPRGPDQDMNRMYVAEPMPTVTGARADQRLGVQAGRIGPLAAELARRLGIDTGTLAAHAGHAPGHAGPWLAQAVADLEAHRGAGLVLAGPGQPAAVHALVAAMNDHLGNTGTTVAYVPPVEAGAGDTEDPPGRAASLDQLVTDIRAGLVEQLLVLGGNPAYTAPADVPFAEAAREVRFSLHLGLHADETAEVCQWHVPRAHYLETWSDARAYDGTISILQPLIEPLHQGRSEHEILAVLDDQPGLTAYRIVRGYWKRQRGGPGFERFWKLAVHDGVIPGSAAEPVRVSLGEAWKRAALAAPGTGLELVFAPDNRVAEGSFANNAWMQEMPDPITRLTWDNAALMSPATAAAHGLSAEDVVELRLGGRSVRAAVWEVPGTAADTVVVHLGYGRRRGGRVAGGAGFDAYQLRAHRSPHVAPGLELASTGERYALATTQHHHTMEGRDLVRHTTLDEYRRNPDVLSKKFEPLSLYPDWAPGAHAWGMSIDLTTCTGCSACVIACQAENNIPTVGKEGVRAGREMHWIRVDRYYQGSPGDPHIVHQPVPCMHCEKAPCEPVCPVAATVHSADGLNDMIYNRCVGTRFCSNNCPYKVRRFNFFGYAEGASPLEQLRANPDVTVRSRGVMEKCTYCVQRIRRAGIEARKEGRAIRDGEVQTACQQACPTEAIVFGDAGDPDTRVSREKRSPRDYALLEHLNTRPRTTYLGLIRNPRRDERG
jgi:Fe-S-cluster-containing dehydrogenase component/anaerobic selenocysteine-containing dehydrogenase